MRQVTRTDVDVTSRKRHVARQLALDCEVALVRVSVFKVFLHVQCERQHWSKSRERLIVEPLPAKLVLRARCNARCDNARRTDQRDWSTRRTYRPLEHLHRIEQSSLRRAAGGQNALLLLHGVGDVGVERDR